VAEQYGTEHHEFDLARDLDLQQTIRRFADYADEPCGDSSSLPVWYLSKMCREHVTVTLSGEGADELFGGYLTYQADRLRRLALRAPAALRGLALAAARRFLPVSEDKISVEYMVKRFLEGVGLPELEAHCYWNGAFSESQKRDLCALAAEAPVEVPPRLGRLNRFLWYDQRYYLPDDILAKVDRMSMAHSLEVRPPFLDHQVVEFAARLPERFKIRGRQQKYLLKRLMRDRLPSAVLRRKKVGFDIPAHDWLRRELKPLLLEALNPAALGRLGLFREGAVERLVEDHLERRANLGFHLWGLMILLLWIERWQLQSPLQRVEQAVPTPTLIP
jgi:asparagine synthase (glutamine-hydrolysing)